MSTTTQDLDKILRRVQGLIAKAESTQEQFPEEADAFRRGAEALMHQYRIEESMLAAAAPVGTGPVPVWSQWRVCPMDSKFKDNYRQVASWIAGHVGAEGIFRFVQFNDEDVTVRWLTLDVVGYESDLRYGEMLLTSCLLAFGERMEPKVDPNLSEQVNAYRLRRAGLELRELAVRLRGPEANTKSQRRALRMMVLAECKLRGEDPDDILGAGNNMKTFRASYGQGFSDEIYWRLMRMRHEVGDQSQAVVLASRKDAVKEAFYSKYPQYKPNPATGRVDPCPNCAKAKSGHCRKHPAGPALKAQPENYRARRAGASAAMSVDLGDTKRLT